jgi:hypothetical protein
VVIGALWLVGQLPPSSGLLAVEVWPDALRLRVAAATEPLTVAWADVLDVAFVARDENYEYVSGGRSRWSVRHAAVVLAVNGQTEPLVLVHLRRPQQLAVEIARHAAAVRAATADRAEAYRPLAAQAAGGNGRASCSRSRVAASAKDGPYQVR